MKGLLAINSFIVFSLFLFYFAAFPGWKWRINCPECYHYTTLLHPSYHEHTNVENERKTNISHILFGIGGSAATWNRRRHYTELWWKPNITRGFVWLDKEPRNGAKLWPETSPPYKVSANTSRFKYTCPYGSRSAVRIARIVKESFELGLENVRWFVMGDDDTIFFPENLVNVLNKYDHNEMYYIGGNSESVEQDVEHSYTMAYGGGGFAISYPLAAVLVTILDACIDRYAELYGSDLKIGGCMSEIGVPVTKELGFHQLDVQGNAYGLLSAHPLTPLVSLHHLDYVQPLFPGTDRLVSIKKLVNAYKTDPGRTLQHSFYYDLTKNWSISISWGYSVQLYPFLVTSKDLSTPLQTYLTWATWSRGPFTFNTRILNMDPCKRPVIFYLDRVNKYRNGHTLTWYRKGRVVHMLRQCETKNYADARLVKGFKVSSPFLDPRVWNKAPRRQCCEVINGSDQQDNVVQVRIRSCNHGESVTPP